MEQPIGIYMEYRPHAGAFDEFLRLLRQEAEETLRDDGCLRMEIAQPETPDGRVFLIELWRDAAAIEAHRMKPGHSHAWQEPLIAEKRVARCRVDVSPSPKA